MHYKDFVMYLFPSTSFFCNGVGASAFVQKAHHRKGVVVKSIYGIKHAVEELTDKKSNPDCRSIVAVTTIKHDMFMVGTEYNIYSTEKMTAEEIASELVYMMSPTGGLNGLKTYEGSGAMSLYTGFFYRGIVKEKYRQDIAAAVDKKSWTAVVTDEMRLLVDSCLAEPPEYTEQYKLDYYKRFGCFPCSSKKFMERQISFDEQTGVFVYTNEWNTHDMWENNVFRYHVETRLLPVITDKIIQYHTWHELLEEEGIIDGKSGFEAAMKKYEAEYQANGIENLIAKFKSKEKGQTYYESNQNRHDI